MVPMRFFRPFVFACVRFPAMSVLLDVRMRVFIQVLIQFVQRILARPVAPLLHKPLQRAAQAIADKRLLLLNGVDELALLCCSQ